MHVISFLFFVLFNLAVPSNQAKLANEGSNGDFQESNLPMFEKFLTEFSTEMYSFSSILQDTVVHHTINSGFLMKKLLRRPFGNQKIR